MTMLDQLVARGWPHILISLDDWDALPEDNELRLECVEGMVVFMAPGAGRPHGRAQRRLLRLLEDVLPRKLEVFTEFDVLLSISPLTVRRPGLVVCDRDGDSDLRALASEVHLVVEIISAGSRRTDRVTKLSEYAEAGIPEYWILDVDEREVTCFSLTASGYEVVFQGRRVERLSACGVTLALDVDALVAR